MGQVHFLDLPQAVGLLKKSSDFTVREGPDGSQSVYRNGAPKPLSREDVLTAAEKILGNKVVQAGRQIQLPAQRFASSPVGKLLGLDKGPDGEPVQPDPVACITGEIQCDNDAPVAHVEEGETDGAKRLEDIFAGIPKQPGYQYFVYDPTAGGRAKIATEMNGDIVVGTVQYIAEDSELAPLLKEVNGAKNGYVVFGIPAADLGPARTEAVPAITAFGDTSKALVIHFDKAGFAISPDTAIRAASRARTAELVKFFAVDGFNDLVAVLPAGAAKAARADMGSVKSGAKGGRYVGQRIFERLVGKGTKAVTAFGGTGLSIRNLGRLKESPFVFKQPVKLAGNNGAKGSGPFEPLKAAFGLETVVLLAGARRRKGAGETQAHTSAQGAAPGAIPKAVTYSVNGRPEVVAGAPADVEAILIGSSVITPSHKTIVIGTKEGRGTQCAIYRTEYGWNLVTEPNTVATVVRFPDGRVETYGVGKIPVGRIKMVRLEPGTYEIGVGSERIKVYLPDAGFKPVPKPEPRPAAAKPVPEPKPTFPPLVLKVPRPADKVPASLHSYTIKGDYGVHSFPATAGADLRVGNIGFKAVEGGGVTYTLPPGVMAKVVRKNGNVPADKHTLLPGDALEIRVKGETGRYELGERYVMRGSQSSKASDPAWQHNVRALYSEAFAEERLGSRMMGGKVNVTAYYDGNTGKILGFGDGSYYSKYAGHYPAVSITIDAASNKIVDVSDGLPTSLKGLELSLPMEWHL